MAGIATLQADEVIDWLQPNAWPAPMHCVQRARSVDTTLLARFDDIALAL